MKLTTDCAFHIGAQHLRSGLPCQDYAVSGVFADGNHGYAVVSDGCSSGGKTDVGARIIALTAERYIRHPGLFTLGDRDLGSMWSVLPLEVHDLLATSVMVQVWSEADVAMRIAGDGVVAVKYRDGRIEMTKTEWAGNMPWYPAYAMDADLFEKFFEAHRRHGDSAFRAETWVWREGEEVLVNRVEQSADSFSFVDGFSMRRPLADVAVVAAFSDGVCQIDGGLSWQEAVVELLHFRTTAGAFVKRRMNRFLRDIELEGFKATDDISCAAILVEP